MNDRSKAIKFLLGLAAVVPAVACGGGGPVSSSSEIDSDQPVAEYDYSACEDEDEMCVEAFTIDNQRFVSTCVPVNVGDLGEVVAEGANDVPFAEVRSLDAEGIAVRKKNGAMCPYAEGEWFKLEAADK